MKAIELSEASKPLSEYVKELDEEIIVLTSDHKPVAALVSLKNVDRESLALSTDPEFMAIIEAAREEFRSGKRLSLEEMKLGGVGIGLRSWPGEITYRRGGHRHRNLTRFSLPLDARGGIGIGKNLFFGNLDGQIKLPALVIADVHPVPTKQ